ncbi:MAG: hypothetical protein AB1560_01380 [Pseudomonadota bacterium]
MRHISVFGCFGALLMLMQGCVSTNTFPMIARAGDTVSVMAGGSNLARKDSMDVSLTDSAGQVWDLKSLGLVRSVFNLRTDGLAHGLHYSSYLELYYPWSFGHEPLQTVLVADLPTNVAPGNAVLTISPNVNDDSSGVGYPYRVNLEIIPGTGTSDKFLRKTGFGNQQAADLGSLEQSPHAKISFSANTNIGAVSLKLSFDSNVLNGDDINLYVPESTVRGSIGSTGAFGATQRMVYWRQDGQFLYVDVVAPQGISSMYLQLYILNPRGLTGSPNFTLISAAVYDVNGALIAGQPTLQYYP